MGASIDTALLAREAGELSARNAMTERGLLLSPTHGALKNEKPASYSLAGCSVLQPPAFVLNPSFSA
jgi:hypothetical protein